MHRVMNDNFDLQAEKLNHDHVAKAAKEYKRLWKTAPKLIHLNDLKFTIMPETPLFRPAPIQLMNIFRNNTTIWKKLEFLKV